jgi:hypothetical protein
MVINYEEIHGVIAQVVRYFKKLKAAFESNRNAVLKHYAESHY